MPLIPAYAAFAAFVSAFALTPLCRAGGLRLNLLDVPNARSSHAIPTPRTGGVAIIGAFLASSIAAVVIGQFDLQVRIILITTAGIAILGLVDDVRRLSEKSKFVVQIVCAVAAISVGRLLLESMAAPSATIHLGTYFGGALSLIWILSLTNSFNFMDGINGIAATQAAVAGGAIAIMFARHSDVAGCALAAAVGAAALGFLPFNLPSGSIFMGDTGSAAIGFCLSLLAIRLERSGGSYIAAVLCVAPFLADTGVTLLRRILAREHFFSAHRSHFYQRLAAQGWTHAETTGLWTALACVSATVALMYEGWTALARSIGIVMIVTLHAGCFVLIHLLERRRTSMLLESSGQSTKLS